MSKRKSKVSRRFAKNCHIHGVEVYNWLGDVQVEAESDDDARVDLAARRASESIDELIQLLKKRRKNGC